MKITQLFDRKGRKELKMSRKQSDSLLHLARLQREVIPAATRTVEGALMKSMTALGDLATFASRDGSHCSTFEREEASDIIGSLLLSVLALGDAMNVDVVDAAHRRLSQLQLRPQKLRSSPQQQESSAPLQTTPKEQLVSQVHSPQQLESPTNISQFFRMLHEVSRCPIDEFNKLGLKYVAPHNGTVKELIPDGQNVVVTHDRLPHFLQLVEKLAKNELPEAATAHPPKPAQHEEFIKKHVEVAAPPGYNPDAVGKLFSPTHFTHGLFSPHSKNTAFDVEYPAQRTQSSQPASSSASPGPTVPNDTSDFQQLLKRLESGEISGSQIGALRLTFCVPGSEGKVHELQPGGSNIPVSAANVNEFLRLAKANHPLGRVRRQDSIKTLELGGAVNATKKEDRKKFSPTHGSKDLFAPIDDRRTFVVDYDCEADTLPAALRHANAPPAESVVVHNLPTAVHYQDYLRHGGSAIFHKIVEQIEADPVTISRLQVTWCTPASVAQNPTDEELSDGIHDLIRDGRNTLVNLSQVKLFIDTVKRSCIYGLSQ
jgi:hypothetical protein